jgi:hypothetical protein
MLSSFHDIDPDPNQVAFVFVLLCFCIHAYVLSYLCTCARGYNKQIFASFIETTCIRIYMHTFRKNNMHTYYYTFNTSRKNGMGERHTYYHTFIRFLRTAWANGIRITIHSYVSYERHGRTAYVL